MKFSRFVCLPILATALSFAVAAHATTIPFVISGDGVSGSGTVSFNSSNYIYAITGTTNGSAITQLLPGQDGGDQLFSANSPHLTYSGLSYALADGQDINLYFKNGYLLENFTDGTVDTPIANPFVAPESSSLIFLGTGIFFVAGVTRWRTNRV